MALRVEWLGLAEGSTQDARGALALVGVNQNVIQAPSLPHTMKEVFVLYVGTMMETPLLRELTLL
jgi:hypothetical protein